MKNKIYNIFGVALTVALLASLIVGISASPASAVSYDKNEWESYKVPEDGEDGDFVISAGSNVGPIVVASDGTIYAADAYGYGLYKSTDGGFTWEELNEFDSEGVPVVDIVISPVDDEVIFVATTEKVFKSTVGGEEFKAKSTNVYSPDITSMDVTYFNDAYIIVIGTNEGDGDGEVYIFDEAETFGEWVDRDVLLYGIVLEVALSPFFEDDRQIVAVILGDNSTDNGTDLEIMVTTAIAGGSWNDEVADSEPIFFDYGTPDGDEMAVLDFPADYDADPKVGPYVQFLGVGDGEYDSTNTGVYQVLGVEVGEGPESFVDPLDLGNSIQGLAVKGDAGDALLVAGLQVQDFGDVTGGGQALVRYSPDGGNDWYDAAKEPSGEGNCYVAANAEYFYAGTSGEESAFSRTMDNGDSWTQTGLIDSDITDIKKFQPMSGYPNAPAYLVTQADATSGEYSLWRTNDKGETYERLLSSAITIVQSETKKYESDWAGSFSTSAGNFWLLGTDYIWKSDDDGATWTRFKQSVEVTMNGWVIIDETEIFITSGDDLYKTENGGTSWKFVSKIGTNGSSAGVIRLRSEEIMMASASDGDQIRISYDFGESWENLNPDDSPGYRPGEGGSADSKSTFDPGFLDPNSPGYNTVYAYASGFASDTGIWRYTIDDSADWEPLDEASFPDDTQIDFLKILGSPIAPDEDATMYATTKDATLLRAVYYTDPDKRDPDYEVEFTVIDGGGNNRLDSVTTDDGVIIFNVDDSGEENLYMYYDTLNRPLSKTAPTDGASSGRQDSAVISWTGVDGAEVYEYELDEDPSFELSPTASTLELPNVRVTGLESGREYFWHVRVVENENGDDVQSPWSEVWSLTTALGAPQWNPFMGGVPEAPVNGATNVPLTPSFAWNAADGATGYEFVLADDPGFANPIVSKTGASALTVTVYLSDRQLENSKTYYWKVRAISRSTSSEWASGVFTTEGAALPLPPAAPLPPAPPPASAPPAAAPGTPVFIWVIIGIGAALVIVLIIRIVGTRASP